MAAESGRDSGSANGQFCFASEFVKNQISVDSSCFNNLNCSMMVLHYLYFLSTLSRALMTRSKTSLNPSTRAEVLMLKDGKDR